MSHLDIRVGYTNSEFLGFQDALEGLESNPPGFSYAEDLEYLLSFKKCEALVTKFGPAFGNIQSQVKANEPR